MKSIYINNKDGISVKLVLLVLLFGVPAAGLAENPPLAFRGAQGFAKYSKGGRGGKVIVVSDLSDRITKPKKNTLRWAIEEVKGPRVIVFSKSGYITLEGNLTVKNPFVTIAGQSAPEGGITIRGASFVVETHDVVVRHVRFRLGSSEGFIGQCNPKKSNCTLDSISLNGASHVIFDHISASWSVDEIFSGADSDKVTLQNSILADALSEPKTSRGDWLHNEKQSHAYCSLYRGSSDVAFIHNIFANCQRRYPDVSPKGENSAKVLVAGNYMYNFDPDITPTTWNSSTPGSREAKYAKMAIVNNYWDLPGAEKVPTISIEPLNKMKSFELYVSGNLGPTRPTLSSGDDWRLVIFEKNRDGDQLSRRDVEVDEPFAPIDFELEDAERLPLELPEFVGATVPSRDEVDIQFFERIENRERGFIKDEDDLGGYPDIREATGPADSDRDGMPDEWENARGSDPKKANANDDWDGDGYTLIDDYLDELAGTMSVQP